MRIKQYKIDLKTLLGIELYPVKGLINIGPHSSGKNQPPNLSFNTRAAHRLELFLKC